jgi:Domain of unknown function (DUF4258)
MVNNKSLKRWSPVVIILFLLVALFFAKQCKEVFPDPKSKVKKVETVEKTEKAQRGLNRNPAQINYSRHARCRMDCRKIDETEVKDILKNGAINYKKSEIGNMPDCKRKYAVEGTTRDKQRVRIIFSPCANEVTVVTVIDIGKEWPCDCE